MLPHHRDELTRRLPGELVYPYFRGREAAWLLHQRLARPARIADLRRGPLAPLVDRPGVRETVRACGDGRLDAARLLPLADPLGTFAPGAALRADRAAEAAFEALCAAEVMDFTVTFCGWLEADQVDFWGWNQTSRKGGNLVVQVNFPDRYGAEFDRIFQRGVRESLEFWGHPVRRDGPITMSWARLDLEPDSEEVLIEEIQTDWLRVLPGSRRRLLSALPKAARPEAEGFIAMTRTRYGRVWAEATLLAAMAVARRFLGARRVWLHQPHTGAKLKNIRDRLPPRSLYTDLPRRFCFGATDRAPEILYRARSQAVHRLRRAPRPVFWQMDLGAPAA